MLTEFFLRDCINKKCTVTMFDNSRIDGKIIEIESNWIKIEDEKYIRIISIASIKDIIAEKNNPIKKIENDKIDNFVVLDKKEEPKKNQKYDNTVILTHGDYWYRAFDDSAYVISFITDYKLFEDSHKRPTIGFPVDSIDKVIGLLKKYKINYYLKYEDEYVDFGEENNFEKFLHHDIPFSYARETVEVIKKPKGKYVVQYEGEQPEEYVIGQDISAEAELTKRVENSEIGDTVTINGYNIKIIDKKISYE